MKGLIENFGGIIIIVIILIGIIGALDWVLVKVTGG